MAIHFDNLPGEKPISLPDPGMYYATIEKAEMKTPKDTSKPDYLNMQYSLKTPEGKSAGKIFDILSESDHEIVRYKLGRFLTALDLDFSGTTFELKDLVKVVPQKQMLVDVTIKNDEQYGDKAEVDVFTGQVYYPLSEASFYFGETSVDTTDENAIPSEFDISAEDAEDANNSDDEDF